MDSPDIVEGEQRNRKKEKTGLRLALFRSIFAVAFSLLIFLLLSFSVLYFAVLIGNLSIWSPISVHSRCRIVSSSVDLRSSKVCELGLLNYKAKHVFYPFERKKYRCHYDYYWASVFKVEYIDHSGQARYALAEAPNEALPYNCRPSFGAAWLTKDKFKVNETYECWYTLGISKVNINHEGLFNCQAEDPTTAEMLKRYSILFSRILKSWFFSWGSVNQWRWDVIAGLITGFTTSLLSITLIGLLRQLISITRRLVASWTSAPYPSTILLKRACFFAVYFSFMSWVTIQYVKRLGLS
ncbi:hypothetical protein Salat_1828700 [Sesamum alatum]|uniref:Uncharacterized protein n=1 Tax=Sesamum alatum TaxID=300844 RepID=A0AAE2CHN3_9LAMI|nr:hypothetical protein Salat_1828700 [Sesamum alatum]